MNLLKSFTFELPTKIEYGIGISGIARSYSALGSEKCACCDRQRDSRVRPLAGLERQLQEANTRFVIFDEVEPNPKDQDVQHGAEQAQQLNADCLVAIGGGSPIDCAKAIGVVATHGGSVRRYADRQQITGKILPLIAIPTAVPGGEVTFGAVITDTREHFKFTVKHANTAPKIALVDTALTVTMPPALTTATGMDALTHAIERLYCYCCRTAGGCCGAVCR